MSLLKLVIPTMFLGSTVFAGLQATAQATVDAQTMRSSAQRNLVPLARDASTFREDVALTNACVDAGQDKRDCLCVTRILKYELSLPEYRAASQLMFTPANANPSMRRAATLVANGPAARYADIQATLISQADFIPRCTEADRYFRPNAQR